MSKASLTTLQGLVGMCYNSQGQGHITSYPVEATAMPIME